MIDASTPTHSRPFVVLLSLLNLVIVVQGLLAGVFLQGGSRERYAGWITAHGVGADLAVLLALLMTVLALREQPRRRDLVSGSTALSALLLRRACSAI